MDENGRVLPPLIVAGMLWFNYITWRCRREESLTVLPGVNVLTDDGCLQPVVAYIQEGISTGFALRATLFGVFCFVAYAVDNLLLHSLIGCAWVLLSLAFFVCPEREPRQWSQMTTSAEERISRPSQDCLTNTGIMHLIMFCSKWRGKHWIAICNAILNIAVFSWKYYSYDYGAYRHVVHGRALMIAVILLCTFSLCLNIISLTVDSKGLANTSVCDRSFRASTALKLMMFFLKVILLRDAFVEDVFLYTGYSKPIACPCRLPEHSGNQPMPWDLCLNRTTGNEGMCASDVSYPQCDVPQVSNISDCQQYCNKSIHKDNNICEYSQYDKTTHDNTTNTTIRYDCMPHTFCHLKSAVYPSTVQHARSLCKGSLDTNAGVCLLSMNSDNFMNALQLVILAFLTMAVMMVTTVVNIARLDTWTRLKGTVRRPKLLATSYLMLVVLPQISFFACLLNLLFVVQGNVFTSSTYAAVIVGDAFSKLTALEIARHFDSCRPDVRFSHSPTPLAAWSSYPDLLCANICRTASMLCVYLLNYEARANRAWIFITTQSALGALLAVAAAMVSVAALVASADHGVQGAPS
jgi:hypothetical protein